MRLFNINYKYLTLGLHELEDVDISNTIQNNLYHTSMLNLVTYTPIDCTV